MNDEAYRRSNHPRTLVSAALPTALLIILLVACGAPKPPEKEVIVPDTTVELDEAARDALIEFAPDGTLRFALSGNAAPGTAAPGPAAPGTAAPAVPATLAGLEPGDVLVSVPTTAAPDGLLRKVVTVTESNGELVVTTVQAKLREAIFQGQAHLERTLTPADLAEGTALVAGVALGGGAPDGIGPAAESNFTLALDDVILYDRDGDESTTDDQVKADGSVSFTPSFVVDLGLDYDWTSLPDLEVYFRAALEEEAELSIVGNLNGELDEEVELASYRFAPIVVPFGIPLVFTPKLTLLLGVDGRLTVAASYHATQSITVAVGVENDGDHGWEDLSEVDSSFGGEGADFAGAVNLKGYASVKFDLFLYGLVGPYGRLDAFLELDGKVPRAPAWYLYGGLEAWAGIDSVDVLDVEYSKKIVDLRGEIARAGNSAPEVAISTAGGERQLNQPVSLSATVSDREDGSECCTVRWSSDVDGELGTSQGRFPRLDHTFTSEGQRTLTLTATDSEGASASDSVTITVSNSPPSVAITKPSAAEEVHRDLPYRLRGTGSDPNEPDRELPCENLSWTSSLVVDAMPANGCEGLATFDSNGPRTITLTGTDAQGASASTSVDIVVVDPPDVAPPVVRIVTPRNGAIVGPDDLLHLNGEADDPTGAGGLEYHWSVTYDGAGGPVTLDVADGDTVDWRPSDTIPGLDCEVSMTVQLDLMVTSASGASGRDYVSLWILLIC